MDAPGTNCKVRVLLTKYITLAGTEAVVWIHANIPPQLTSFVFGQIGCSTPVECCETWMADLGQSAHNCPGHPPAITPLQTVKIMRTIARIKEKVTPLVAKIVRHKNAAEWVAKHSKDCVVTRFGCCPDMITAANANKTNCSPLIDGCAGTEFGCCLDGVTDSNENGTNCAAIVGGCSATEYGCCANNVTAANENRTNCTPMIGGCSGTKYGCCLGSDKFAMFTAAGTNCQVRSLMAEMIMLVGPPAMVWIDGTLPPRLKSLLSMQGMCSNRLACCEMWMMDLHLDQHYCPGNPPAMPCPLPSPEVDAQYIALQAAFEGAAATLLRQVGVADWKAKKSEGAGGLETMHCTCGFTCAC